MEDGRRDIRLLGRKREDAADDVFRAAVALRERDQVVSEEALEDIALVCGVPVADAGDGRDKEDVRAVWRAGAEVEATHAADVRGFVRGQRQVEVDGGLEGRVPLC